MVDGGDIAACGLQKGRQQVDAFDQLIADRAAGGIGLCGRIIDDQRHLRGGVLEEGFFAEPVIAEEIAMIGGHHDHRVVHPPGLFQPVEQYAHLIVALLDQAHVGFQHLFADVIARERPADRCHHETLEDGVSVVEFLLAPDCGKEVVRPVHVVIRRRHDIGPMRLDIGQVAAPGLIAFFFDEFHCAPGQVGRFAVLFGDVGRFVRVLQEPSGQNIAVVVDPGIGIVVPGIVAVIAFAAEIFVVLERTARIVETFRTFRTHAVVALVDVEAAFGDAGADGAVGFQAEAAHAFRIRGHVGLADQPATHAVVTQIVAHGPLADFQRHHVPGRAMAVHVAAGVGGHARRAAQRRLDIGTVEPNAPLRQPVDIRCLQMRMTITTQIIPAQLVEHDEQNVPGLPHDPSWSHGMHRRSCRNLKREESQPEQNHPSTQVPDGAVIPLVLPQASVSLSDQPNL